MEKPKTRGDKTMNYPKMTPVSSSNVAEIGYDAEGQIVHVRFLNGSLYIYKDVPQFVYDGLLNASSVGSYLHRNFKNVYAYERIG
jgi:hypothetical protein